MERVNTARNWIKTAEKIVFLGGAGVSTASGIPDFRSATGLYNQVNNAAYSPETMLSHDFFVDHPDEFSVYYKENLIFPDALPNSAHHALVELEKRGKKVTIITQNIDGLHQKAGSKNVIEIHGNLTDHYCVDCHQTFTQAYALKERGLSRCDRCGGTVRPDVVLYGEPLNMTYYDMAVSAVAEADVFIIGGTSLKVYPAAGLLRFYNGNHMILINQEPTPSDRKADMVFHEDLGKQMEELIHE